MKTNLVIIREFDMLKFMNRVQSILLKYDESQIVTIDFQHSKHEYDTEYCCYILVKDK